MRLTDLAAAAGIAHAHDGAAGRRQHVRQPVRAAADRVRRRSRACTARRNTSTATATASAASSWPWRDDDIEWLKFVPERRRRDPVAVRLVAGPARHQDAGGPHDAQHNANGLALATYLAAHPEGEARLLSRAAGTPAARAGDGVRCAASAACSSFDLGSLEAARRLLQQRQAARARREPRRR